MIDINDDTNDETNNDINNVTRYISIYNHMLKYHKSDYKAISRLTSQHLYLLYLISRLEILAPSQEET